MKKALTVTLVTLSLAALSTTAFAEPIVGTWKRNSGTLIKYSPAGGSKFCGKVLNGEYKGKSIGCMSGSNGEYEGKVNKLDEGKTYSGTASVKGNTMKLAGCVLGGLICKTERLKRQ